jgi:hypothetical protein
MSERRGCADSCHSPADTQYRRGFAQKPPFPHARPAIDPASSMLPIGPRPSRFVLGFAWLGLREDGIHRRRFIALLGAAITAARTLRAQQKTMPVIGFLGSGSPGPLAALVAAFRRDSTKPAGLKDKM